MDERGLVERVDSLTAAVADLGFKLETLLSSTTAFRESFGERMTDYADLVAHWSIETEQNLQGQRRTVDRAQAAQDEAVARLVALVEGAVEAVGKSERRTLDALEAAERRLIAAAEGSGQADLSPIQSELAALRQEVSAGPDLSPVLSELAALRKKAPPAPDLSLVLAELRNLRDEPAQADALAAVLAEVAAVRKDMAKLPRQATDITPVVEELRQLREVLSEADVDDVEDEVSFAAALGEQLAALRSDVAAIGKQRPAGGNAKADPAVVEAIAGLRAELASLRDRMAAVPSVPPEVTALTDALQALRSELESEPFDVAVTPAPPDDRLEETLAELVYEVRALRRRFPVRPATAEEGDEPSPGPRRRRRSTTDE